MGYFKVVCKVAPLICHKVAETISATCSEHSYQHGAPGLPKMLCTCFVTFCQFLKHG